MKSYEKCVKLLSYGPCLALIGSLLIGSPQGRAQNIESNPSAPARFTVAPHTSSRIAMETLPRATCVLHPEGGSGNSRPLKLFSDDEGMIRFNVNPRMESDEVAAFAVDCASDSESRSFELQLRPSHNASLDMPAPTAEKRAPKASDFIRPALKQAEALQLSDAELVKREYPVRPNAAQAPEALASWLRVVTQPARRLNPRQVAHPELRASSNWELLTNWSGFELRAGPCSGCGPYDALMGEWNVPTVKISNNNLSTYSAFWIGIDGDGLSDLWQAGTEQDIENESWWIFSFDFTNYDAWTELVPTQPTSQVLPNFNVSPGDEMYSAVWVGNQEGAPTLFNEMYGFASVEDVTRGEYAYIAQCLGQVVNGICTDLNQTVILGQEAEWIMERPCFNCENSKRSYADLADYGAAWMYDAYALETDGSWMNYNGANNQDIWMYNSSDGHLLSVPFVWDNTTIEYEWYNYY
jgi:hypothetical protein